MGSDTAEGRPPALPASKEASREERRFNRFDRDRNDRISRVELMSSRTAAFRKFDKDGNILLTFEWWAAATGERFARPMVISRAICRAAFATTAPKRVAKPQSLDGEKGTSPPRRRGPLRFYAAMLNMASSGPRLRGGDV